jgi:hypothetical protein
MRPFRSYFTAAALLSVHADANAAKVAMCGGCGVTAGIGQQPGAEPQAILAQRRVESQGRRGRAGEGGSISEP